MVGCAHIFATVLLHIFFSPSASAASHFCWKKSFGEDSSTLRNQPSFEPPPLHDLVELVKDEFSVPFGGFSPNSFVACSNVKNRWFPPKSLLDGSFVTVLKNDSSGGQSDGRIVCNTAFKYACKASFLSFTKA